MSRCDFACHYCTVLYFVRLSVQIKNQKAKKKICTMVICSSHSIFIQWGVSVFELWSQTFCFARTDGKEGYKYPIIRFPTSRQRPGDVSASAAKTEYFSVRARREPFSVSEYRTKVLQIAIATVGDSLSTLACETPSAVNFLDFLWQKLQRVRRGSCTSRDPHLFKLRGGGSDGLRCSGRQRRRRWGPASAPPPPPSPPKWLVNGTEVTYRSTMLGFWGIAVRFAAMPLERLALIANSSKVKGQSAGAQFKQAAKLVVKDGWLASYRVVSTRSCIAWFLQYSVLGAAFEVSDRILSKATGLQPFVYGDALFNKDEEEDMVASSPRPSTEPVDPLHLAKTCTKAVFAPILASTSRPWSVTKPR